MGRAAQRHKLQPLELGYKIVTRKLCAMAPAA